MVYAAPIPMHGDNGDTIGVPGPNAKTEITKNEPGILTYLD